MDSDDRLRRLETEIADLRSDLGVLRGLVRLDHSAALNKMRFVTEKVLLQLCRSRDVSWGSKEPTLENMFGPLVAVGILPKDVSTHVRVIQTYASPGSHYQEAALSDSHVQMAQMALLEFLEWHYRVGASDVAQGEPERPAKPKSRRFVAAGVLAAVGIATAGTWAVFHDGGPARKSDLGPAPASVANAPAPVPTPVDPWLSALDGAIAAGMNGDWETASERLANAKAAGAPAVALPATLTEGVAAYAADPVVEITEPTDGATVSPGPLAVLGRLVTSRATDRVFVNGAEVPLAVGAFHATLMVPDRRAFGIDVEVRDRGTRRGVTRRVSLSVQAVDPWRSALDAAVAAGKAGEWEKSSQRLAEAKASGVPAAAIPVIVTEGVALYEADPVLEVTEPADDARIPGVSVRVRGTLRRGRETDEVLVDGTSARRGPGAFDATVTLSKEGPTEILVVVQDRGAKRAEVRRTVIYEKPKPTWREFVSGWASIEGAGMDATTGYPKRIRRLKDDGEMVLIPAGTFQMGAVPGDSLASGDEKPRHAVTLSKAYYVDEAEVTIGQWKKYVSDGGGVMPTGGDALVSGTTDACPMHEVSWNDIQGYLRWAQVSLPTEAQWERAAKGGHDEYVYPWGTTDDEKKRSGGGSRDGFGLLAPVRSFPPNDYGLYDMSGNVWEWCADWSDEGYYATSPSMDPPGPVSASSRVLRGGSWGHDGPMLRASVRSGSTPSHRNGDIGFRCSRSLP